MPELLVFSLLALVALLLDDSLPGAGEAALVGFVVPGGIAFGVAAEEPPLAPDMLEPVAPLPVPVLAAPVPPGAGVTDASVGLVVPGGVVLLVPPVAPVMPLEPLVPPDMLLPLLGARAAPALPGAGVMAASVGLVLPGGVVLFWAWTCAPKSMAAATAAAAGMVRIENFVMWSSFGFALCKIAVQ
jgi:hypothetical protein